MARDGQKEFAAAGKVVVMPRLRKTSLSLTLLEFSHALVLTFWVGSLAGIGLVVVPALAATLPDREVLFRATREILERAAFLGCGAGAFLLLTTLLMHLLSLRPTRSTLAQVALLLVMTGSAVGAQLLINPRIHELLVQLPVPIDSLPADDARRAMFLQLHAIETAVLAAQVLAGAALLLFAVRRWYRYLPDRRRFAPPQGTFSDPRFR